MDEELKDYLQSMEGRTLATVRAMIQGVEERTAALIAAEIGNLHTQMQKGFAHVDARFDSIDARLKLQAGLIQSGARAMARFSEFAENSEERWVELADRVQALERRLDGGTQGTA